MSCAAARKAVAMHNRAMVRCSKNMAPGLDNFAHYINSFSQAIDYIAFRPLRNESKNMR